MKKLQIISIISLVISIIGFILWRFDVIASDWVIGVSVVIMIVAISTAVFSSVKIAMSKNVK